MPYIINEDFEPIVLDKKDLKHFGVIGMKWGVRRHRRAASVARKDAADLRKHGFTKEADAVDAVASRSEKKAANLESKIAGKKKELKEKTLKLIDDLIEDDARYAEARGKSFDREEARVFWEDMFSKELSG